MKSYLAFVEIPTIRKTHVWEVRSLNTGAPLGAIYWFNQWRRYVFAPYGETVFDVSCLTEIAVFIAERMNERKTLAPSRIPSLTPPTR